MSAEAIERAYALDISPTEQRVLLVIAQHCDGNGHNAYPSVGLIAWKLGLKERHVQRTLHGLVDQDILVIVEQGGGRGRTTRYRFDLTAGPIKSPFEPEYLRLKGVIDSTPFSSNGGPHSTPFKRNGVPASTPFTDNHANMTGLSAETVSQPVHPLAERVSSDDLKGVLPELKGVISELKGVIASTPESTLKDLKDHHQKDARAISPAPALALIPDRGGGGGDDGMGDDEDTQAIEAESGGVRDDLIDGLIALGLRPREARLSVESKAVTSDRDLIACKRYLAASTANTPPAVLWSQYLSLGKVPIIASASPDTPPEILEAARRMREESDRMQQPPAEVIGARAMAEALRAGTLQAMPAAKKVLTRAESFWRST